MYCKDESSYSPVTVRPIEKRGINSAQRLSPDVIVKKKYLLLVTFYRTQILGTLDLQEKIQALCELLTILLAEVFV